MKQIAIIGGGIGGMTAAFYLARIGHQVTIFESSQRLGGLAAGFKKENWQWSVEEFYHHWFQSDHYILGLIDELGLKDKVHFFRPKTVVYYQGDFYPLDSPIAALFFPGFSLTDKIRFGFVTIYLRYLARWQPLEKYTASEWMRRYYGQKLYETYFEPLLMGKFNQYYQQANMAWFWARFKARSSKLGTFEGGFQAFIDLFSKELNALGVKINLNSSVTGIDSQENGNLRLTVQNKPYLFDQVLFTSSPASLATLVPTINPQYLGKLSGLKSIGAVVLVLSLKHQLSKQGYYWFNLPKSAGFPFLALVEHTNFIPSEYFGNEHIVYCGDYLNPTHENFSLSKNELLDRFLPSLKKINPDFSADWVTESWLFRNVYAQPIPMVNHSINLPSIKTPIPNLFFASMSQVYPWDRGTNFAVQLIHQAVNEMEKG